MKSPYFYTYALIDPRTELPFYIGKGCNKRMYQHETGSKYNHYLRERIAEIKSAGLKLIYEKWFESEIENACYWMEIYIIDYFGRENLTNLTRGGEGIPSGEDHPIKDPKVRAKMGASKIGNTNRLGKYHTEETKQKISKSHIGLLSGENHPMFGKHHTEESCQKIKEGRLRNAEKVLEGMRRASKTHKEKYRSDENYRKQKIKAREKGVQVLHEKWVSDIVFQEHMLTQRRNRVWVTKDGKSIRIKEEESKKFLENGYIYGRVGFWVTNKKENRFIMPEKFSEFLEKGYKKGRT